MNKRVTVVFATVMAACFLLLHFGSGTASAQTTKDYNKMPLMAVSRKMLNMADAVMGKTTVSDDTYQASPSSLLKPASGLAKEVVGYYTEDWPGDTASLQSLQSHADEMSGAATFSFQLKADGSLTGSSPSAAIQKMKTSSGKALVLIHNYNGQAFDKDLIHTILNDPSLQATTIANILAVVQNNGYDGVNIDFENIPGEDRALYTQFISQLSTVLHQNGYLMTVSVPAKTYDESNGWGGAFDYSSLGQISDDLMLMTYDEHYFGSEPGAIASAPWVEQVVQYATSQVPSDKILLGLGMYGYDWNLTAGKTAKAISSHEALQQAAQTGADIRWDSTDQVPYYHYNVNGINHVVYFESDSSASFKMDMVNKYNLAGIAIWRLGYEDDGFWQAVNAKFSANK